MKTRFFFLMLILSVALYFPVSSDAGTDITITPEAGYNYFDLSQTEADYEAFIDGFFTENEEVIPSGLAMVNTLGYPNGKSTIKPFPHFEFGVAAGVGAKGIGGHRL